MSTTDRLHGMPEPPKGWDVRPLKRAADINRRALPDETSEDFEFPYIEIASVDGNGRIELDDPIRFGNAPSRARRVVRPEDTVISTVRTYLKAIGRIDREHEGAIASTGFAVLTPRDDVHPDYLWRFVQSDEFVGLVQANSIGIGYPSIAPSELGALPVFVPPFGTQRAIADFLDRETAKIDTLIEKKQRLLKLLDEKRTALITRAVTRGLDPDVPMKDSGVEWIGEIPEHWDVVRLRRVIQEIEQGWSPQCHNHPADAEGWGVLKAGCVNNGVFSESENKALPESENARPALEVEAGDLLMSRASGSADLIGSAAYVERCRERLMLSDKVFRLHERGSLAEGRYLALALSSRSTRVQIRLAISGAGGLANNISQDSVMELVVCLPPKKEQPVIVEHVSREAESIDQLKTKAVAAILLLEEYRTALISAAVTGKLSTAAETGQLVAT